MPQRALNVGDLWCSLECTPACQAGGRGFKSRQVRHLGPPRRGRVAQLVERAPEKREVTGSTPVPTTEARWPPTGLSPPDGPSGTSLGTTLRAVLAGQLSIDAYAPFSRSRAAGCLGFGLCTVHKDRAAQRAQRHSGQRTADSGQRHSGTAAQRHSGTADRGTLVAWRIRGVCPCRPG